MFILEVSIWLYIYIYILIYVYDIFVMHFGIV